MYEWFKNQRVVDWLWEKFFFWAKLFLYALPFGWLGSLVFGFFFILFFLIPAASAFYFGLCFLMGFVGMRMFLWRPARTHRQARAEQAMVIYVGFWSLVWISIWFSVALTPAFVPGPHYIHPYTFWHMLTAPTSQASEIAWLATSVPFHLAWLKEPWYHFILLVFPASLRQSANPQVLIQFGPGAGQLGHVYGKGTGSVLGYWRLINWDQIIHLPLIALFSFPEALVCGLATYAILHPVHALFLWAAEDPVAYAANRHKDPLFPNGWPEDPFVRLKNIQEAGARKQ